MDTVLITVIISVYNVERYLRQCPDSVVSQAHRRLEILLIDDGSTDACGKICDEYAHKDNRISVFHTENRGLSAARNLGLSHAHGEYISFLDSDDWIEENAYELLLAGASGHPRISSKPDSTESSSTDGPHTSPQKSFSGGKATFFALLQTQSFQTFCGTSCAGGKRRNC